MTESDSRIEGKLLAVCLSTGGIPKLPVEAARVATFGLEGDGHTYHLHGGENRAVSLLSTEEARQLALDGVENIEPGAFGENLRTEGVDFALLIPGDRLAIGTEVELELYDLREPCGTLKTVDQRFPDLMVGRSGILCRVIRGGEVHPGQSIRVLATRPDR